MQYGESLPKKAKLKQPYVVSYSEEEASVNHYYTLSYLSDSFVYNDSSKVGSVAQPNSRRIVPFLHAKTKTKKAKVANTVFGAKCVVGALT